jgi:DNA transformation protein
MSEFTQYLPELLQRFGTVVVKRMFSGHGVYHQGLMFGLVHEEALYLKTDAVIAARFDSQGLSAFAFRKGDRLMTTSFRLAPPEALEDPAQAAEWARLAFEAALRVQAAKRPRRTTEGGDMATGKQKQAAKRNIKKAAKAAKKKRTIAHLPKKTRTALGKQGSKAAKKKAAKKKKPKAKR